VQVDEDGQPVQVVGEVYILDTSTKKKKACGSCCLFAVATFLLCFFLIPRTPTVWLSNLSVNQAKSGIAESAVTGIVGTFKFRNENFFKVEWDSPDMSLYWLPYNNQPIVGGCWGEDPCAFYQNGWCAIKLGEFANDEKFSTGVRAEELSKLKLKQTLQQTTCSAEVMVAAAAEGTQRLLSKGTVGAKVPLSKFGRVHVSDSYYLLGWN